MTAGFAVGPLLSGMLAQWAPAPRVLPYLPHVAFMVAAMFVVARLVPETVTRRTQLSFGAGLPAGRSRRRFWRTVAVIAPWVFAAPAVAFAFLPAAVGATADRWGGGDRSGDRTDRPGRRADPAGGASTRRPPLALASRDGRAALLHSRTDPRRLRRADRFAVAARAVRGDPWLRLRAVPGLRADRGRTASAPDAVGSLTAVYYALAYLGLTSHTCSRWPRRWPAIEPCS